MIIGDRLRQIRISKEMSQGDIEQKTGLLRCYVSRVENGHTVPAVETLEKFCRALDVPMYKLFYEGEKPPKILDLPKDDKLFGSSGKDAAVLRKIRIALGKMSKSDIRIIVPMAQKMAQKANR